MRIEIICLFNGLGNQLSQYALYQEKLRTNNAVFLQDNCTVIKGYTEGRDLDSLVPNIEQKLVCELIAKVVRFYVLLLTQTRSRVIKDLAKLIGFIFRLKLVNDENYHENRRFINIYVGGWLGNVIENPKNLYDNEIRYYLKKKFKNVNHHLFESSCAIHFRGGDYLDPGVNSRIYGGICDIAYYENAIRSIRNLNPDIDFVVFTNDKKRAKKTFDCLKVPFIFAEELGSSHFIQDFCLMACFKNIILSNSSFSFWAACSFSSDKNVICPSRYRNIDDQNIFLETWTKVDEAK